MRRLPFPWLPVLAVTAACNAVALAVAWRLHPVAGESGRWADAWAHWDAGWYAAISESGYAPGGSVAFFPLYPLAIRAVHALGVETRVAGILLSLLAGGGASILFYAWARRLAPEPTARLATWLMLLFPFSFYVRGAMYSDGLFLLVVLAAFLALEEDRPGLAAVLGALATAGRPVAPAVVLGLCARRWELSLQRRGRLTPGDALPLLSAAGLLAWMGYLWWRFGDPLAFMHAQDDWGQGQGWHTWAKVQLWHWLAERARPGLWLRTLVHAGTAFAVLWTSRPLWCRFGRGHALYVLAVMGIPVLATKDMNGLARYALPAFPAFLPLAAALEGRPRATRAVLWGFGGALLLLAGVFATDFYLA